MSTCLSCFEPLDAGQYHSACSRKVFGTPLPPVCDLSLDSLPRWALQELGAHHVLTGAQRKISAHWDHERVPYGQARRLTVVGALGGRFILKPASPDFAHMPLNEALTMALARKFEINTAPSALLTLADGSLAYITQRFDRTSRLAKIPCEDMAQLTGTMTEDKYRGSVEQIGDVLCRYSAQPGVDMARLFALVVFCYLVGNSDMHLKNYSMLVQEGRAVLSPAYDLLNVRYHIPEDDDFALSLNGKRRRLRTTDFKALARHLGVSEKFLESTLRKIPQWWSDSKSLFDNNLVPPDFAKAYMQQVEARMELL